jgi:hypothetical protein
MKSMPAALSFILGVGLAVPAAANAPLSCVEFLAADETKRIEVIQNMDFYAAGFRDAMDLACPRNELGEQMIERECLLANGGQSYLYETDKAKLEVFERECRSDNAKNFRKIIHDAIIDRMNHGQS